MKAQVVSFHCVLKNSLGKVIGSTFNHDVITVSDNPDAPLPGLARNLQNLKSGEKRRICLTAGEAYGFYDPKKVIHLHREQITRGDQLRIGDQVAMDSEAGGKTSYRVTRITGDKIELDANHPLAGQDLVFEIETVAARDARPDELEDTEAQAHAVAMH